MSSHGSPREMEDGIDVTNVLQILERATANNLQELKDQCMLIINENAVALFASRQILEISEKSFLEIIKSDGLRLDSELQVFLTVSRMAQRYGRGAVERFIPHIRFPCMSLQDYSLHVVRDSHILNDEQIMSLFLYFGLPPEDLPVPEMNFCTRPRDYRRRVEHEEEGQRVVAEEPDLLVQQPPPQSRLNLPLVMLRMLTVLVVVCSIIVYYYVVFPNPC